MHQNEKKANPYFSEANRQGFTPEQMARGAALADRLLLHYDNMEEVSKKLTNVLCWATHAEELDKSDLQLLSVVLLSVNDYGSADFSFPFEESVN